jgi:plastocyanin
MKTWTDRQGNPGSRRALPKLTLFHLSALIALAILVDSILPSDTARVLGYTVSAPSPKASRGCSYQVRPGDNLYRIGLRYGVSYQYLAALNGIYNPHSIFAGMFLTVPCVNYPQPSMPPQPCGPVQTYVVNPGDNLFRIALNHGSTVELLRSANNLYGRVLRPGRQLIVPCAGSTGYRPLPPSAPTQEIVAPPANPTVAVTPTTAAVTPEVTLVSPTVAITPEVTPQAVPATGTGGAPAPTASSVSTPPPITVNPVISMSGNRFIPDTVQVNVGARVTWLNAETDGTQHSVTCVECPPNSPFDSGSIPLGPGQSFSILLNAPGVYSYDSRLQPDMTGIIIVNP